MAVDAMAVDAMAAISQKVDTMAAVSYSGPSRGGVKR